MEEIGYSIIGQGKIDEILSNKSEDRRHIFEEAAGIVKFRARKEESEKKIEHTKLNLLRINDILLEIENNIGPLKNQSDKAKNYLTLKEELKDIEIGLFIHNINKYKEELIEIEQTHKIYLENCNLEEGKLEKIQILKEELKNEIDDIINKIENVSNLGFESRKEIEILNSEISVCKTKIEGNIENKTRFLKEIEDLKGKKNELEDEINQKAQKKNSLKLNKEKFEIELKQKSEELNNITDKLSSKELEIEKHKEKIEKNVDDKYELQSQILVEKNNIENFEKRQKQLKQDLSNNISELDGLRIIKTEITSEFLEIENKRNQSLKKSKEFSDKREKSINKINSFVQNINLKESNYRIKESKLKFLIETEKEKDGYIRSVKELLKDVDKIKELGQGMHGVLANIIDVKDEYKTAIEMALGAALQNIITDNEEDAKKLVEHLRKNNLGRASFLPISSVKGQKLNDIKTSEKGYVGIASDLITFDKKYEKIILNFLGRTVIVDNMKTAISISKQFKNTFKIVTLEGDIINQTGAITGGSVAKKSVNILGRGKEIEKLKIELEKLNNEINNIKIEKEKFEEKESDDLEEISSLEKELQEIDIVYATKKQKLESIEENILKLDTKKVSFKEEIDKIIKSIEKSSENVESIVIKIEELTNEINNLSKIVEEFMINNKDTQNIIDDLNFDITNLRISVSSFDESEASIFEIEQRIKNEILNAKNSIENKEKQIEIFKNDNEKFEKDIKDVEIKITKIQESVENSQNTTEELKKSRIQKNEKLSNKEIELTEKFKIIEDLKSQITKIDVKKTKIDDDLNQTINKMWEEYELTPNTYKDYKKPDNIANTQREVNKLRTKIKELRKCKCR